MTGSTYCEGWTFRAGTFELAFILSWAASLARDQAVRAGDAAAADELTELSNNPQRLYAVLPLRSGLPEVLLRYAPYLLEWMSHPDYDDYWRRFSPREMYDRVRAPALHVGGWYDSFLTGTLENFTGLQAAGHAPQSLVVGPWYHMPWSQYANGMDFGCAGRNIVDELQRDFFADTLQGGAGGGLASSVQLFVMGTNRWRHDSQWPPPPRGTRTLFLASDGRANSLSGTGTLTPQSPPSQSPFDAMPCNPVLPVISVGGRSCCVPETAPMGPADQRSQEIRNDVLVYTSEVLAEDLLVIGAPTLVLHLAVDTPSADVIARLTDVHPDGASIGVSDGVHRLAPDRTDRGARVEISIAMAPTAICFKAGHRIRLTLAGSDFPARDRNPNNGTSGLDATWSDFRTATQAVFHDGSCPSRLVLPLVSS
jgi:putative CocE/NonD family hydrolase